MENYYFKCKSFPFTINFTKNSVILKLSLHFIINFESPFIYPFYIKKVIILHFMKPLNFYNNFQLIV